MLVARIERKNKLNCQSGDPHVVKWNFHPLPTKIIKDLGIETCRIGVRQQQSGIGSLEKCIECFFVSTLPRAAEKSGPQFPECKQGKPNFFGPLDTLDDLGHTASEVRITIGVEQNSHFHSSGSMRFCSSKIASVSGSVSHVPAISE